MIKMWEGRRREEEGKVADFCQQAPNCTNGRTRN